MGGMRPAGLRSQPLIGFVSVGRVMWRAELAAVRDSRSVRGLSSEGDDAGGRVRRSWPGRGQRTLLGAVKETVEGGFEPMSADQGVPHHRGNLETGAHWCAGATARHVDAELQSAQTPLTGLWEPTEKFLDQGHATCFKGAWIVLGQTRPFIEIEREAETRGSLHPIAPGYFSR